MSTKYQNIRVAAIYEDSKVSLSFVDTLNEAEFHLVLEDPLQMELLTWLVSRHTTLYQGDKGEIVYKSANVPIEGNRGQSALDLIHTLRNEQPVGNNLEHIRRILLDLAQEAERLEYIFCTHQHESIQNRFGWIQDAMIEDIQSYIDGTQAIIDGSIPTGHPPAGGKPFHTYPCLHWARTGFCALCRYDKVFG